MAFKRKQVVMLPTNQKAIIGNFEIFSYDETSIIEGKDYFGKISCGIVTNIPTVKQTKQHLYILSDEEIKEGDWCCNRIFSTVFQTDKNTDFEYINKTDNVSKIIATTDKSLEIVSEGINPVYEPLPQIPQSFIEYFISEHEEGNIITEVMVKYEVKSNAGLGHNEWVYLQHIEGERYISVKIEANIHQDTYQLGKEDTFEDFELEYNLKINSESNTIITEKVKNSWSLEEVLALHKLNCERLTNAYTSADIEWIKSRL